MRQFQCVPTTYGTEIKETYFEIYTKQVSCPLAFLFKNLKLPISFKIPVTIYLHDSCITKFDFMKYAFAKLLLAPLYLFKMVSVLVPPRSLLYLKQTINAIILLR